MAQKYDNLVKSLNHTNGTDYDVVFPDVPKGHWAYDFVKDLSDKGYLVGYPDGTFKGQNNITRYEMAQMIAKGMANQDRANAEQQALLNRLAQEFSNELNTLGVRVAKLEDRVGNVKLLVMLVSITSVRRVSMVTITKTKSLLVCV